MVIIPEELKQKLCKHYKVSFHGLYSMIGYYVCDYCGVKIDPQEYQSRIPGFTGENHIPISAEEYYGSRLYAGEAISSTRDKLSSLIKLAERIAEQSEYANGILIYGDDNDPNIGYVQICLKAPTNPV